MKLPKMVKIRQKFTGESIPDIARIVSEEFSRNQMDSIIQKGMRIAVTAGSRGVANIAEITKCVCDEVKKCGAEPFIVPSMGSHGGATAEGQVEVLESLGITETYCQAPILSSMEVVTIGETVEGIPVYMDQHAFGSDGVIVINRIKLHTDFKSNIESGLMKMATIGLGKHKQALMLHTYGIQGIRDLMPKAARIVFNSGKILCGFGIVENAFEQTSLLELIPTALIEEREQELLNRSASLMPKLLMEDIDLLIVDEIGKNYSGTGMDTNIIGRIRILGVQEPTSPRIKYILARDLSEESHGNALGIGLADLTTRRLLDKIDYLKMNENVITSTFLSRASVPIVLENDRLAIEAALRSNWGVPSQNAKIVHISNTLHLEELHVSEAVLSDLQGMDNIEILGEADDMAFDNNDNLVNN
ncbi:MAG: lactate racemase domain-containing protein [Paenibacillaceae bacterium]